MSIRFDRAVCGDLAVAEQREWLVTNGRGGYASGTVAGLPTRAYHGLLIAALNPPLDRTLLLAQLDDTLGYRGTGYDLSANRWTGGVIAPEGYKLIESFRLEGTVPVWRFACADVLLEKRIWMEPGASTTHVRYTLLYAPEPVTLWLKALADHRSHHSRTRAGRWQPEIVTEGQRRVRVTVFPGATPLYLTAGAGIVMPANEWYDGYELAEERARGLDDREDHLHVATFQIGLAAGESVQFTASTDPAAGPDGGALDRRRRHEQELLDRWTATRPDGGTSAPDWVRQYVLAADQFIVDRPSPEDPDGKTVIAGYHWFSDWGRDTMISLPGLTLATGRPEIARSILRTFARYASEGMLPNQFPDSSGDPPQYNTVDASLWYFQAIRAYHRATGDDDTLRALFPVLADIVDWHCRGTRYGIKRDPADGLLRSGEPGTQLTWMDVKIRDRPVTARVGKPVEVNALWYNALNAMAEFAERLGRPAGDYRTMADAAGKGFDRFWNPRTNYCYDGLDGPGGPDAALRPNQILAVSLPDSPLSANRQRAVVRACARALLASPGLRTLDRADPAYIGRCAGDQEKRDSAYHQGTVWAWLKGPFIEAHLRVHGDPAHARRLLEPMADLRLARGLGTIGEIFDGDPPFHPRGAIAQAWSVAEVLRVWHVVEGADPPPP